MIRIVSTFCAVLLAGAALAVEQSTVVVQSLVPGSPAEATGIVEGDILHEYNGSPVTETKDLLELKESVETDSVEVVLLRDGERITVTLPAGQLGVYLKDVYPELEYQADAVVIDDVPPLSWDSGKYNSFLACVEAVANHLGIDKDYVYLNGVSGAAFRLHFHRSWCPSSPDPGCGYPSCHHALAALGLEDESRHVAEDDTAGQADLRRAIMASIDRGMPVIAIDLRSVPEWGIVTGYQDGGSELICRSYFDRREGYDLAENFPWAACLVTGTTEPPTDEENYRTAFAVALENLTTPEYDGYMSGLAAFDYWIEQLQATDFDTFPEQRLREEVSHANAWIYDRLVHDRQQASEFLLRVAAEMPDRAELLDELAALYGDEAELLQPTEDVVVYGFNLKDRSDWTAEMRAEQVRRLTEAKAVEEEALAIWEELAAEPGEE